MPAEPIQIPAALLHPGVFERITEPDQRWLYAIKLSQLDEASYGYAAAFAELSAEHARVALASYSNPRRSYMTKEWADALLTFPGTVWFVDQATGLGLDCCARLCRSGMPWLLSNDSILMGFTIYLLSQHRMITPEQEGYFTRLIRLTEFDHEYLAKQFGFELRKHLPEEPKSPAQEQETAELAYYRRQSRLLGIDLDQARRIFPAPETPLSEESSPLGLSPEEDPRAYQAMVADLTGESPKHVWQIVCGLCCYHDCLHNYALVSAESSTEGGKLPSQNSGSVETEGL